MNLPVHAQIPLSKCVCVHHVLTNLHSQKDHYQSHIYKFCLQSCFNKGLCLILDAQLPDLSSPSLPYPRGTGLGLGVSVCISCPRPHKHRHVAWGTCQYLYSVDSLPFECSASQLYWLLPHSYLGRLGWRLLQGATELRPQWLHFSMWKLGMSFVKSSVVSLLNRVGCWRAQDLKNEKKGNPPYV